MNLAQAALTHVDNATLHDRLPLKNPLQSTCGEATQDLLFPEYAHTISNALRQLTPRNWLRLAVDQEDQSFVRLCPLKETAFSFHDLFGVEIEQSG